MKGLFKKWRGYSRNEGTIQEMKGLFEKWKYYLRNEGIIWEIHIFYKNIFNTKHTLFYGPQLTKKYTLQFSQKDTK